MGMLFLSFRRCVTKLREFSCPLPFRFAPVTVGSGRISKQEWYGALAVPSL